MTDERTYGTSIAQLEARFEELRNECSVVASIQRSYIELEARVKELEDDGPMLYGFGEAPPQKASIHNPDMPPFKFLTIESLVEAIEELFDCRSGDYGSFHTDNENETFWRYRTIRYQCAETSYPQELLLQAVYENFLSLRKLCRAERPILYWRFAPEQRLAFDKDPRSGSWQLRTRVAIPEIQRFLGEWPVKLFTEEGLETPYVRL
jgi:hypothetical protein